MENRINQIITTSEGNKYMILHQAIYNGSNYFVCCGVDNKTGDLKEEFRLVQEKIEDGETYIEIVEDEKLTKFLLKNLNLMEKDEK